MKIIQGLITKRPEYNLLPKYYDKAKGVNVWIDGKKYIDMGIFGIGCNLLGFSNATINLATMKAISKGSMATPSCSEEEELGELILNQHKWASQIRFCKGGSESVYIALKSAQQLTSKKEILLCGYAGHFLENMKVKKFEYNDIESFKKVFSDKTGIIIIESGRHNYASKDFFKFIRNICDKYNIILIFDEITSGYRFNYGGYHLQFGTTPDFACFGKAISNGFALGCVIGKQDLLELADSRCILSSTYWTERVGLVAGIATLKLLKKQNYLYLYNLGNVIKNIWKLYSKINNIDIDIEESQVLCKFNFKGKFEKEYKTIFIEQMLKNGILANTFFNPSFAHRTRHILQYENACKKIFKIIKQYKNEPYKIIKGKIIKNRPMQIK